MIVAEESQGLHADGVYKNSSRGQLRKLYVFYSGQLRPACGPAAELAEIKLILRVESFCPEQFLT